MKDGAGHDDVGNSADDIFKDAENQEAAEKAKQLEASKAVLEKWTIRAAGHLLLDRLERESQEPGMPWPGCEPGWPRAENQKTAKLTPTPHKRAPWSPLWQKLGPPRADWLAVLVGRTGRGKSGWALTVSEAVAASGAPVLILSCEMGADEMVARLLTIRNNPHGDPQAAEPPAWRDVLRGSVEKSDLAGALDKACEDCPNMYLWAPRHEERTPEKLAEMVRHVTDVHERAPLVVLDYVQRLAFGEDRRIAVVQLSGKLRDISRPDPANGYPGCAMLVLSSTARSYYKLFADAPSLLVSHRGGYLPGRSEPGKAVWRGPEELEGLGKESGELEYDASVVLCLTCDTAIPGDYDTDRCGILVVAKNRAGIGDGWMPMNFHGPTGIWSMGTPFDREELNRRAPTKKTKSGESDDEEATPKESTTDLGIRAGGGI